MDIKLPTVPDGYEVAILTVDRADAPADYIQWTLHPASKTGLGRSLRKLRRFFSTKDVYLTRVRGDLAIFEKDMQRDVDAVFAHRDAVRLAGEIRQHV